VIVGAACVSPLFFSHILFKSILFLSSNFFPRLFFVALASSLFFSPVLPAACLSCSPLLARTRGPAHDPPLPLLLTVHARLHHAARVTPRPPRPLLLAVHAKPACGPLLREPISVPSPHPRSLRLVPEHPVTLPCRPSPLFLSAYKLDPKPPLTPPTPTQHLPSSTSRCSSPLPLTIAGYHPSPWTALRRLSLHEVRAGIGPPRPPLCFSLLPGRCHASGGRRPWPSRPPHTVPLPLLFYLEEQERQTCA
jgi:hypothetical protein